MDLEGAMGGDGSDATYSLRGWRKFRWMREEVNYRVQSVLLESELVHTSHQVDLVIEMGVELEVY